MASKILVLIWLGLLVQAPGFARAEKPRVRVSNLEIRGKVGERGISGKLLGYLSKRLAAGGTVEIDESPIADGPGLVAKDSPFTGPQFLLGGSIIRSGDLCLIAVQGVAMSQELVTLSATGLSRCEQASLERSLEKIALRLRESFREPLSTRPVIQVDRPKTKGVKLDWELKQAMALRLATALVERGAARTLPTPRVQLILKRRRMGKKAPTRTPEVFLVPRVTKIGMSCLLEVEEKGQQGKRHPSKRVECDPERLVDALDILADRISERLKDRE